MENYKRTTSVIAKRGINGGRVFVKYNTITKRYYEGNSASTAVSEDSSGVIIYDVTNKMVRQLTRQLEAIGYVRFIPSWGKDRDTYGDIKEAGL